MELQEVKKALDDAGQLYHGQFKSINEKIASLEAAGSAVDPLLKETREKLNKAMEDAAALNESFIKQQTVVARLEKMGVPTGQEGSRDFEREARAFNIERRSIAAAKGATVGEATVDEYKLYAKAFDRYLRVGEKALTPDEARALSVGTDSSGGYLVTPDKSGQVVKKIFETSDVRRYASVQAISTDALEGSADLDEASGGWVSELGTRSDSNTPAVPTPWRIPVFEQYSQPKASQKLVNDAAIDIAAWLNAKVSDKLGRDQNVAFVTGSGVGKPRGFASYTTSTTYAWGTPEHVGTGTSGGWGTDPNGIQKLNTLMGLLKDTYVPGSNFFMNRTTKFSIRNLTDASAAGKFVFIPVIPGGDARQPARRASRGVPGHGVLQHGERARHRLREHEPLLPDRRPSGHLGPGRSLHLEAVRGLLHDGACRR
jgi:HK97 family phage major capsid protein